MWANSSYVIFRNCQIAVSRWILQQLHIYTCTYIWSRYHTHATIGRRFIGKQDPLDLVILVLTCTSFVKSFGEKDRFVCWTNSKTFGHQSLIFSQTGNWLLTISGPAWSFLFQFLVNWSILLTGDGIQSNYMPNLELLDIFLKYYKSKQTLVKQISNFTCFTILPVHAFIIITFENSLVHVPS